jgi:hypothetical protein
MTSAAHAHGLPRVLAAPKPIPGGLQFPGLPLLHVFPPGPPDVTLPFTGLTLQGLDVEPSVITDYRGFTALAFHVGTATGSDGKQYNLETDMRAIEGTYVATDGSPGQGQLQGPVGGHRKARASRQGLGRSSYRPGGVPGSLRHRAVDGVVLRVGGRLQLQGQGRHRPWLRGAGPRAQRHLPLGRPVEGPARGRADQTDLQGRRRHRGMSITTSSFSAAARS